ncbi:MAG: hypothetical protein KDE27_00800 [Planctomycetes bacterium]|nr:hypothetical protein [Planctomycetota bacterium]
MHTSSRTILALCALAIAGRAQPPRPGPTPDWRAVETRIAWHGTWEGALAAARSTGRPILLVAAAPHCGLVPGMW